MGRGTFGEVQNGSGDHWEDPRWVGGPFMRSGMGLGTLGESEMGQGTLLEVQNGSGTFGKSETGWGTLPAVRDG